MKNKQQNLEKIIDFIHESAKLKKVFRYKEHHKDLWESTAEHSWRLALMVILFARELDLKIDVGHAVEIALVHDLPESINDDIAITVLEENKNLMAEKARNERIAMRNLKKVLPPRDGDKFFELWNEYEETKTLEAKFVRALNKLEAISHLIENGYKTFDKPEFIAEYVNRAEEEFPALAPVVKIFKEELKEEFKNGNIPWNN